MRSRAMACLLLMLTVGTPVSAATLAIVAEADSRNAAAVLEAELGKQADVKLVDREQIVRVLSEQKLATLEKPDGAIRLGRILGADGVLLVSQSKAPNPALSARLVAVGPGVVLWSISHPTEKFEPWIAAVAQRTGATAVKLQVKPGEATAIAILNLRAAVKDSVSMQLERDLPLLLAHRLTQEPAVYVLERQRMDALSREKDLGACGGFWTGRFLLDGAIERKGDELTVRIRLTPAGGVEAEPFTITGRTDDVAGAVNAVAVEVVKRSRGNVARESWDARKEAAQFAAEVAWGERCGQDWRTIQSTADAAWALGDRSFTVDVLRIRSRLRRAWGGRYDIGASNYVSYNDRQPDLARAIPNESVQQIRERFESTAEALRLYLDEVDGVLKTGTGADINRWDIASECQRIATWLIQYSWQRPQASDYAPAMAEVRSLIRQIDERAIKGLKSEGSTRTYYGRKAAYVPYWFETPAEQVKAYRQVLSVPFKYAVGRAEVLQAVARDNEGPPHMIAWNAADQASLPQVWEAFVKELCDAANPELKAVGYHARMDEGDANTWRLKIMDLFWDHRDQVRQGKLSCFLLETHFLNMSVTDVYDQPYRDRYFRILLDACGDDNAYEVVEFLIIRQYGLCKNLTSDQARQLNDAMIRFESVQKREDWRNRLDQHRQQLVVMFPELATVKQPPGVLVAKQPQWPGVGGQSRAQSWYQLKKSDWQGGKLWVPAVNRGGIFIVGGNLDGTGAFDIIQVPREIAGVNDSTGNAPELFIAVNKGSILLSYHFLNAQPKRRPALFEYDRAAKTWRTYDQAPEEWNGPAVEIGDTIYGRFREINDSFDRWNEGLVAVDRKSGQCRILCSNRQNPARTPLDTIDLVLDSIHPGRDGELLVVALSKWYSPERERRVFAYQPTKDSWREVPPSEWTATIGERRVIRFHHPVYARAEGMQYHWDNRLQYWGWLASERTPDVDAVIGYADEQHARMAHIPVWCEPDEQTVRDSYINVKGDPAVISRRNARWLGQVLATPAGVILVSFESANFWWFVPAEQLRQQPATPTTRPSMAAKGAQQRIVTSAMADGIRQLWRIDPDGKTTQLTQGWHDAMSPAVSPDGSHIVFVSHRDDNADLFLASADGTGLRNLTNAWGEDFDPAFSPDGQQIAFVSRFGMKQDLCVIRPDGTARRTVFSGWTSSPAWSPDGKRLAFAANIDGKVGLYELVLDTGLLRVVSGKAPFDAHPAYWPDGKRLLFVQLIDKQRRLVTVDIDGGAEKALCDQTGVDWPAVSPDARHVLFRTGGPDTGNTPGPFDIHVLDVAAGTVQRVTQTSGGYGRAAWDGK